MLAAEHERILERSWQLAGHVASLSKPGSYLTTAAGSQPALVVRGKDGELRAFRNTCRHRGSRVLSGAGQCGKAIRCRYHGWTYRLDGSLIGMPEVRSFGEIDKSSLGLLPASVDEFCGLVFVNLDLDAVPLSERLRELEEHLAPYRIPSLVPFGSTEGAQSVNWKIVIDNYLEGYHVPIAHPGLMRLLDYKRYELELGDNYAWFEAPLRDKPAGTRLERAYRRLVRPMPGLAPEDVSAWQYVFIYPNTAIDLYPDQMMTWKISPDGVLRTRDSFTAYRPERPGLRNRLVQRMNTRLNSLVHEEDVDLVENVQAGLATRDFKLGPLSGREAAVGWFADRVRSDLSQETTANDAREPETTGEFAREPETTGKFARELAD
ncbi:MAG: aromatic ring-hydroxylating oxygenase subunit alpha [Solirubrobacterales bacterium]